MRHITHRGADLIKRWEGFVPHLYICAAGYPTIGYGHVILPSDNFGNITGAELLDIYKNSGLKAAKHACRMTRQDAKELLFQDACKFEHAVLRYINVPLDDGQFDALVSFTYNLGPAALQRSTLRRKVNREEHSDVPHEFRKWVFAGGRKLKGLIRRRNEEAEVYANG
ncbi:MAG: lysozyme [Proteobacteria bacterium]|nr:lysozyme [Pseudomonadota bacterium]